MLDTTVGLISTCVSLHAGVEVGKTGSVTRLGGQIGGRPTWHLVGRPLAFGLSVPFPSFALCHSFLYVNVYLQPNIHVHLVELISRRVSPYLFTCIPPFVW